MIGCVLQLEQPRTQRRQQIAGGADHPAGKRCHRHADLARLRRTGQGASGIRTGRGSRSSDLSRSSQRTAAQQPVFAIAARPWIGRPVIQAGHDDRQMRQIHDGADAVGVQQLGWAEVRQRRDWRIVIHDGSPPARRWARWLCGDPNPCRRRRGSGRTVGSTSRSEFRQVNSVPPADRPACCSRPAVRPSCRVRS